MLLKCGQITSLQRRNLLKYKDVIKEWADVIKVPGLYAKPGAKLYRLVTVTSAAAAIVALKAAAAAIATAKATTATITAAAETASSVV